MVAAHRPCPVESAGGLDRRYRYWLQPAADVINPYVSAGMRVLDIGCGPGYFTFPLSNRVGETGQVIAADLQQGMLDIIDSKKNSRTDYPYNILLHRCQPTAIGAAGEFDFILAFYMVHEVPDIPALIDELWQLTKAGGRVLIAEPGIFRFTFAHFPKTKRLCQQKGFQVDDVRGIFLAKAMLLTKPSHNKPLQE
jgi:ubiquinone/menaquinone biosynthesis C-methylase UbiE